MKYSSAGITMRDYVLEKLNKVSAKGERDMEGVNSSKPLISGQTAG
jgi:hypothetical protein